MNIREEEKAAYIISEAKSGDYSVCEAGGNEKNFGNETKDHAVCISVLNKMIISDHAGDIFLEHLPIITTIIPEFIPTIGFEQNNKYHCFDVLNHILASVDNAPRDGVLRLTMLFHDIAKPLCYTENNGIGHFYGHPQVSSDIARDILKRLKYDSDTIEAVTQLILYHDVEIKPRRKHVKRWLGRIGEDMFRLLLEVKKADAKAQATEYGLIKQAVLDNMLIVLDEVIKQQQCFSLKDLDVNGRDLIKAGIPQVKVGFILKSLMDMVINGLIENNKAVLLETAERLKDNR